MPEMPPQTEQAELAEENRRLRMMLDTLRALGRNRGLDDLLEKLLEHITRTVRADRASIFLFDRDRDELWTKVAQGLETAEIRVAAHLGLAGACVKAGRTLTQRTRRTRAGAGAPPPPGSSTKHGWLLGRAPPGRSGARTEAISQASQAAGLGAASWRSAVPGRKIQWSNLRPPPRFTPNIAFVSESFRPPSTRMNRTLSVPKRMSRPSASSGSHAGFGETASCIDPVPSACTEYVPVSVCSITSNRTWGRVGKLLFRRVERCKNRTPSVRLPSPSAVK